MPRQYTAICKATGEEVIITEIERCCKHCRHRGPAPDGLGFCSLLRDDFEDGVGTGDNDVCPLWAKKPE